MAVNGAPAVTLAPRRRARKSFTVAEANRALPYVGRIVADIVRVYGQIVELRRRLERAEPAPGVSELERRYDAAMESLSRYIGELQEVGVELKDFEKGLVDFPSVHEGREVLLCWQRGETAITHWHELDAGFAGRRPVAGGMA